MLAFAAAAALAAAAPQFHPSADPALADYPFSESVEAGGLVFLSGVIGTAPGEGSLVEGGIEAETTQIMETMGAALARHGLGYGDIVKCTVFIDDIAEWADFNAVYRSYFEAGRYPARSALGADGLALGAAVELECVAWAGGADG